MNHAPTYVTTFLLHKVKENSQIAHMEEIEKRHRVIRLLWMLEIPLLFETFHLNHLSTNPVHLQGKTCRVENERKIKSRPSGFFLSFKLLYKCTWPSKYFSTNAWHWCLLQCIVIGWMVNGRFLFVPKKNDKVVIG